MIYIEKFLDNITLTLEEYFSNTWTLSGTVLMNATTMSSMAGSKSLSGVLDRIRLTTATALDNFDAGSVYISVE